MSEKSGGRLKTFLIMAGLFLGIPVLLCSGVLIWWLGRNAIAERELNQRILVLREEGKPVDDDSLASYHAQLTDDLYTAKWLAVLKTLESSEFGVDSGNLPILGSTGEDSPVPENLDSSVDSFLAKYATTLDLIHEIAAADMPVRFPIEFNSLETLLPSTQGMRSVSRLLKLEHLAAIKHKDHDREFRAIKSLFGAANAVKGEPIMVSHLIHVALFSIAIDATRESVERGGLSNEQWIEIAAKLRTYGPSDELLSQAINGERALALPIYRNPQALQDQTGGSGGPSLIGATGPRPIDALLYLDLVDKVSEMIDSDPSAQLVAGQNFEEEIENVLLQGGVLGRLDSVLTTMLVPSYTAYISAVVRGDMASRIAQLAVGVRRFETEFGRFPADLDELQTIGIDTSLLKSLDGKNFGYQVGESDALVWGYYSRATGNFLSPYQSVPAEPPVFEQSTEESTSDVDRSMVWKIKTGENRAAN